MAQSNGYIFAFAAGICVVCSLALATASQLLKERQDTNIRRDFEKNILEALGLPEVGTDCPDEDGTVKACDFTVEQMDALYIERIEVVVINAEGSVQEGLKVDPDVLEARAAVKGTDDKPALMPVFTRVDDGKVVAYAIETQGVGLWGPISGYLALAPDGYTVTGSTFFAAKETPGLGYEITSAEFRNSFKSKRIHDGSNPKPISVKKPGTAKILCPGDALDYCVDGISGATITSDGVTDMVAEGVAAYEPYLAHVRAGGGS